MKEKLQQILSLVKKKWVFYTVMSLLMVVLLISGFMIIRRRIQTKASESVLELEQKAVTVADTAVTDTSNGTGDAQDMKELEKPPISVDFEYLQNINPDVRAWLYCDDTEINFAIMQSDNNDYYLYHLADGSRGTYGSAFIDYRCAGDISDLNTIIYAHDMQNGSMFGGLEYYREQDYFESHSTMYLLTPEHNYRLQAICGALHTIDDYIYSLPAQEDELEVAVWTGISRSFFESDLIPEDGDRYITLSTCADDYSGARFAIILKMTEIGK